MEQCFIVVVQVMHESGDFIEYLSINSADFFGLWDNKNQAVLADWSARTSSRRMCK